VIYFENVSIMNNPPVVKEKLRLSPEILGEWMVAENGKSVAKPLILSSSSGMSTGPWGKW
jgi:hypothetical protein